MFDNMGSKVVLEYATMNFLLSLSESYFKIYEQPVFYLCISFCIIVLEFIYGH